MVFHCFVVNLPPDPAMASRDTVVHPVPKILLGAQMLAWPFDWACRISIGRCSADNLGELPDVTTVPSTKQIPKAVLPG